MHTLDLADQNRTQDPTLLKMADADRRVLITKDTDFEISHKLERGPAKLLLITTGNIHNDELLALFARHEEDLLRLLERHGFIELNQSQLIVHS